MAKSRRKITNHSVHAGLSPQTAIATPPAAGRSARLAISTAMRDALYFSGKQRHIPTLDETRKMYGPAVTLGAPEDMRMAMANRLLNKFSMLVFKTSMSDILQGYGGLEQLDTRMQMLARNQSNDGVFAIDKDAEDVVKVETPLSGVSDLVKQSLEQLAAMNRTPAVKLLGISPSGFNATGESDIRNYYDYVLSQQEKVLRHALRDILDVVQISLFGSIDKTIDFTFRPLSEDDKNAAAMTQQVKANTLCALLDRDIISPEEARRVLITDPASGLNDLDPDEVPEPKDDGMGGMGGAGPEQTPEGQTAEESDEISLGRQLLGMDAEPDSEGKEKEYITMNGAKVHLKKGEKPEQAGKRFAAKKRSRAQKSQSIKGKN